MKFYDREKEIEILKRNENKSRENAMFTVLKGRRRIGKTLLVLKALEGCEYVYLFVHRGNEKALCRSFQQEISSRLDIPIYGDTAHFAELFELLMRESTKRHFSVVIDEVQNFKHVNNAIFSQMQDIWDRYHRESHINLIVCGSVRSMMRQIFESSNEPLYGRATSKITLQPFNIETIKRIMADYNPSYTPDDLLCLYMLTGGVAKYIELLADGGNMDKDSMLNYVCSKDSYFITEGREMLMDEFASDYDMYFSILHLIASGKTRVSEIDGALLKPTGVYLANLDKNFEMISKLHPVLQKQSGKVSRYEIRDMFLRFWFRFIYPYQGLIESEQHSHLLKQIQEGYAQFSGKTLEKYFHTKYMQSGNFTTIGNWWSRTGDNEIDMLAINSFDKTGIAAEIKRNRDKISIASLEEKIASLPSDFKNYKLKVLALSLEDM
ncbi:MAG: ATP-binding protein [Bacteroidales bacterium]|nr:ATP-binding protein [Bacteroidales bacterium]